MSRKRVDEEIRQAAEDLLALCDKVEAIIAGLPEETRIALAGPADSEEQEGEPLRHGPG